MLIYEFMRDGLALMFCILLSQGQHIKLKRIEFAALEGESAEARLDYKYEPENYFVECECCDFGEIFNIILDTR